MTQPQLQDIKEGFIIKRTALLTQLKMTLTPQSDLNKGGLKAFALNPHFFELSWQ